MRLFKVVVSVALGVPLLTGSSCDREKVEPASTSAVADSAEDVDRFPYSTESETTVSEDEFSDSSDQSSDMGDMEDSEIMSNDEGDF